MSEADLRAGLRAAVGDEPPLDFDADALIRRARDARRRRRALVAVAVATLALTGTVLALPGVLDRREVVDAAGGPVLTTAVPPPPPSAPRPPAPASTTEVAEGSTTFLSAYLSLRFSQVVPGTKVVTAQFDQVRDRAPGFFTGVVRFVDGVGPGGVVARLVAPSAGATVESFCAGAECGDPRRQPDGTWIATGSTTDPDSGLRSRSAVHFREDGSVVQFTAYDHDPVEGGAPRAEVALTVDQLVELATDPKLAVS